MYFLIYSFITYIKSWIYIYDIYNKYIYIYIYIYIIYIRHIIYLYIYIYIYIYIFIYILTSEVIIHIYIIYMYIYIYIFIYICSHENNVTSRLSPQWLCGNSCTWAHDVRTSCAQVHELPQSHCGDNREGTLFS